MPCLRGKEGSARKIVTFHWNENFLRNEGHFRPEISGRLMFTAQLIFQSYLQAGSYEPPVLLSQPSQPVAGSGFVIVAPLFLINWRSNPGPCALQARALSQSYTPSPCFVCFVEIGPPQVAQADLKLTFLLLWHPLCWDYRSVLVGSVSRVYIFYLFCCCYCFVLRYGLSLLYSRLGFNSLCSQGWP